MAAILEVRNLSIWFRTETSENCVVYDFQLGPQAGSRAGTCGRIRLRQICHCAGNSRGLLDKAAHVEGLIRFAGEELIGMPAEKLRRYRGQTIAMIFQEPMTALNPVMVIGSRLPKPCAHTIPKMPGARFASRLLEAMEAVAIAEPETRYRDYPHRSPAGSDSASSLRWPLSAVPAADRRRADYGARRDRAGADPVSCCALRHGTASP